KRPAQRGRQLVLPVIAAAALVFSIVHVVRAQKPRVHPEPLSATATVIGSGDRIAGTGVVEPASEDVDAGSHRAGIVAVVPVHAQDRVKEGAALFCLDDRAASAELRARNADLTMARAQLARLQNMPRAEELPALVARVGEAQAHLDDAEDNLHRTS